MTVPHTDVSHPPVLCRHCDCEKRRQCRPPSTAHLIWTNWTVPHPPRPSTAQSPPSTTLNRSLGLSLERFPRIFPPNPLAGGAAIILIPSRHPRVGSLELRPQTHHQNGAGRDFALAQCNTNIKDNVSQSPARIAGSMIVEAMLQSRFITTMSRFEASLDQERTGGVEVAVGVGAGGEVAPSKASFPTHSPLPVHPPTWPVATAPTEATTSTPTAPTPRTGILLMSGRLSTIEERTLPATSKRGMVMLHRKRDRGAWAAESHLGLRGDSGGCSPTMTAECTRGCIIDLGGMIRMIRLQVTMRCHA